MVFAAGQGTRLTAIPLAVAQRSKCLYFLGATRKASRRVKVSHVVQHTATPCIALDIKKRFGGRGLRVIICCLLWEVRMAATCKQFLKFIIICSHFNTSKHLSAPNLIFHFFLPYHALNFPFGVEFASVLRLCIFSGLLTFLFWSNVLLVIFRAPPMNTPHTVVFLEARISYICVCGVTLDLSWGWEIIVNARWQTTCWWRWSWYSTWSGPRMTLPSETDTLSCGARDT